MIDTSAVADQDERGHLAVGCVLLDQHEHPPLGTLEAVARVGGDGVYVETAFHFPSLGGIWTSGGVSKLGAWLARVPEVFNRSFANYQHKSVRVKQKDEKWGFVYRSRREWVGIPKKTYIREMFAKAVQGKVSGVDAEERQHANRKKVEQLVRERELRIKARGNKSGWIRLNMVKVMRLE